MSVVRIQLAIDAETGLIDTAAPFLVLADSAQRSGVYVDEPEVFAQMVPGEQEARFEAEWTDGGWKFGKRVADA